MNRICTFGLVAVLALAVAGTAPALARSSRHRPPPPPPPPKPVITTFDNFACTIDGSVATGEPGQPPGVTAQGQKKVCIVGANRDAILLACHGKIPDWRQRRITLKSRFECVMNPTPCGIQPQSDDPHVEDGLVTATSSQLLIGRKGDALLTCEYLPDAPKLWWLWW